MQEFSKYQGTGNDFVMIDNRDQSFKVDQKHIESLCSRRFGVGADGLILLENQEGYDFKMVYFNADGHEGSMCGNGGRCTIKFAHDLGVFKDSCSFIAVDGPHEGRIEDGLVILKMSDVSDIQSIEGTSFINTGSPHVLIPVNQIDTYKVVEEGKKIRNNSYWLKNGGTNVNFVEPTESQIVVRTYERGVEDETYSCGTGVTAAALNEHLIAQRKSPIKVKTLGGILEVTFVYNQEGKSFNSIYLKGPAQKVFQGTC